MVTCLVIEFRANEALPALLAAELWVVQRAGEKLLGPLKSHGSYLREQLFGFETFQLGALRRTRRGAIAAAFAENPIHLADLLFGQIGDRPKGAHLQAALATHTGQFVDFSNNGAGDQLVLE